MKPEILENLLRNELLPQDTSEKEKKLDIMSMLRIVKKSGGDNDA